jgi:preprotein translocase subunit SecE
MTTGSIIALAVAGVVFFILWQKGYLLRFAGFVRETKEELKKCAWPTKDELVGSTVVVFVALFILGGFTALVDTVVTSVVRYLSNI